VTGIVPSVPPHPCAADLAVRPKAPLALSSRAAQNLLIFASRGLPPRAPRTTQPRISDAAHAAHATRSVLLHWARQNTHADPSPRARSTAKDTQRAAPRLSEQHWSSTAKFSAGPGGQARHKDGSREQLSKRCNARADGCRARDAHRLLLGEPEGRPLHSSRSSRSRRPPRPGSSRCRCSNRIEGPHRCADDLQRSRRSTSPRAEGRGARARGLAPAPAHLCRQLPDMSELEAGITRGRQLPAAASCPRQTVRGPTPPAASTVVDCSLFGMPAYSDLPRSCDQVHVRTPVK